MLFKRLALGAVLAFSVPVFAQDRPVTSPPTRVIELLDRGGTIPERIAGFSEALLGIRYIDEALGEGLEDIYDQDPQYRFDGLDCTTYLETVMALSLSRDLDEFRATLQKIRYRNGVVAFRSRNHMPDADWMRNNIAAGFIEDITAEVAGDLGTRDATAEIDRRGWFRKLKRDRIRRSDATPEQVDRLHASLKREMESVEPEVVTIPYIAIDALVGESADSARAWKRLKAAKGAMVNIVRPNWDLVEGGGTHLNISHQGLIIAKPDGLYLRHASSSAGKTLDQPLKEYLRKYAGHQQIKGINILRLRNSLY